jgi:hypothetical protein
VRARDRQLATFVLEGGLVLGRVGDVLSDPLLAAAAQVDHRRDAREVGRDLLLEPLELVGLDLERQVREQVVRHRHDGPPRLTAATLSTRPALS